MGAHISKDSWDIIRLTHRVLVRGHLSIDQLPKLTQQIGAEAGAPSADCDSRIRRMGIRPFHWQRAQPPRRVQIRHAVPAPVVAHAKDLEGLPLQGMERVRDGENL